MTDARAQALLDLGRAAAELEEAGQRALAVKVRAAVEVLAQGRIVAHLVPVPMPPAEPAGVEGLLDEFESACLTYAGGPEFAKENQAARMVRAREALRRALQGAQGSSRGEPVGYVSEGDLTWLRAEEPRTVELSNRGGGITNVPLYRDENG